MHTIFNGLDESKGLAPQVRAGFFAQQHITCSAAGRWPDIEHDEEFSSDISEGAHGGPQPQRRPDRGL